LVQLALSSNNDLGGASPPLSSAFSRPHLIASHFPALPASVNEEPITTAKPSPVVRSFTAGQIPTEIGLLTKLESLCLPCNSHTGMLATLRRRFCFWVGDRALWLWRCSRDGQHWSTVVHVFG
jgi:hypothetical protein